jgi:hypothetical protein
MKDVRPQKPSNLSKELSYHHDACVHSEFSICPSGHREKEAIHQSRRPTPKTSSSLEPSRHRSEKQLVGKYIYIYIWGCLHPHQIQDSSLSKQVLHTCISKD